MHYKKLHYEFKQIEAFFFKVNNFVKYAGRTNCPKEVPIKGAWKKLRKKSLSSTQFL